MISRYFGDISAFGLFCFSSKSGWIINHACVRTHNRQISEKEPRKSQGRDGPKTNRKPRESLNTAVATRSRLSPLPRCFRGRATTDEFGCGLPTTMVKGRAYDCCSIDNRPSAVVVVVRYVLLFVVVVCCRFISGTYVYHMLCSCGCFRLLRRSHLTLHTQHAKIESVNTCTQCTVVDKKRGTSTEQQPDGDMQTNCGGG